jgi:hypothetical protein
MHNREALRKTGHMIPWTRFFVDEVRTARKLDREAMLDHDHKALSI